MPNLKTEIYKQYKYKVLPHIEEIRGSIRAEILLRKLAESRKK
jgi:hypothetical protein